MLLFIPAIHRCSAHAIRSFSLLLRACSAATGYMVQEFFSLPAYPGYSPNPVEAVSSVPAEGLLQIVAFLSWVEISSNKGKFSMTTMFEDGRAPGDLGFDPLKFGENKETRARLELAELKNGRLAMLAFSGMIHQVRKGTNAAAAAEAASCCNHQSAHLPLYSPLACFSFSLFATDLRDGQAALRFAGRDLRAAVRPWCVMISMVQLVWRSVQSSRYKRVSSDAARRVGYKRGKQTLLN